jgi:predicted RNase H-like HicB family nuclease
MNSLGFVYWQDGLSWVGFLEDYPEYVTQGESLDDLQDHLRELFADLSGEPVPTARTIEFEVA